MAVQSRRNTDSPICPDKRCPPSRQRHYSGIRMTPIAHRILADIRELAPTIAARAAEIEAARRIPRDLIDALKSIDVFRLVIPRSHGGLELELSEVLEIISALSRIEGSVGWTVMIGFGAGLIASLLPRETYDQVYRNGPNVILPSRRGRPNRQRAAGESAGGGHSPAAASTPAG